MRTSKILCLLTVPVLCLALNGCLTGGGQPARGAASAVPAPLRVGITPNMPPLAYKQGRQMIGLEVDLAQALGQELHRPVQLVELKWTEQIEALRAHKTDVIMSGMSLTGLRSARIAFSEPYLRIGQMALARRSDVGRFFTRGTLVLFAGRVGVEKGTTGDLLVQQEFRRAQRKVYAAPRAALPDLLAGRLDLLIHDAPVIWWLAAEQEAQGLAAINILLSSEYLAWGLRLEDEQLQRSINRILEDWKRSAQLQRMIKRWIPYALEI